MPKSTRTITGLWKTAAALAIAVPVTVGSSVRAPADSGRLDCCSVTEDPAAIDARPAPPTAPRLKTPAGVEDASTSKSIKGRLTIASGLSLQRPDLARAVVYLAADPALDAEPRRVDHATVAQRNKAFVPDFLVVSKGTNVEFPNWDDFDHNVFSRSKAAPAFDLDRYPRGTSKSRTFDKVGVVQVFCNIHPQMRAIIVVTPNRHFARCDGEGRFELADVPPGHYEIIAWQERCGEHRQSLDVTGDETPEMTIGLEESRKSIMENTPPRHDTDYGIERGLGVKRESLGLPVVPDAHPAIDAPPEHK